MPPFKLIVHFFFFKVGGLLLRGGDYEYLFGFYFEDFASVSWAFNSALSFWLGLALFI